MQRKWLNPALWVTAVIVVNLMWGTVVKQEAPKELNNTEQTEPWRTFNLEGAFGSSTPLPVSLEVKFTARTVDDGNVSYVLRFNNETEVHRWAGTTQSQPPVWQGELQPGTYVLETQLEEGLVTEQTLYVAPFEPLRAWGHVGLTLGLIVVSLIDQAVRNFVRNRMRQAPAEATERAPFKPLRRGMPDADVIHAEDSPWRDPLH